MTDFIHTVTPEDEGLELKDIMREHFDFSSRLRNKIKREKLVMLNGVRNLHTLSYKASVELDCDVHCFFYRWTDCGHIVSFSRGCDRSETY